MENVFIERNERIENALKNSYENASHLAIDLESKEKDELAYNNELVDTRMIAELYETLLRLHQWDDEFSGEYKFVKRLVRVRKFFPKDVLAYYKPETHFFEGLFMELEVCLVRDRAIKYINPFGHRTAVIPRDPKAFGLPGFDEVNWSTYREVGNGYGAVISIRGDQNWIKDHIRMSKNWEYIECDM